MDPEPSGDEQPTTATDARPPTSAGGHLSRRAAVTAMAVGGAAAWIAPQIVSVDAASAATVFAPRRLVAVGSSGTVITSNDAVNWILQTTPTTNNLKSVAWSPALGLFASTGSGGTIITSPDGIVWTARTSPTIRDLNDVQWDAPLALFVVEGAGHTVITSADGITWTIRDQNLLLDDLIAGAFSPTLPLIVTVGPNGTLDTSPDGITWTTATTGAVNIMRTVAWSPTLALFVIAGDAGEALTSPDGLTWTPVVTGTVEPIASVRWDSTQAQFVAVLDNVGGALTSPDGSTWSAQAIPVASLKDVARSNALGLWIAVGASGTVKTSPNGATPWTPQTTPTNKNLQGIVAIS